MRETEVRIENFGSFAEKGGRMTLGESRTGFRPFVGYSNILLVVLLFSCFAWAQTEHTPKEGNRAPNLGRRPPEIRPFLERSPRCPRNISRPIATHQQELWDIHVSGNLHHSTWPDRAKGSGRDRLDERRHGFLRTHTARPP